MSAIARVSSLLVGTLLLLTAVGTTASLVPLVLAERGISPTLIGVVAAAYNLGLAGGGHQVGRWVGQLGHVRTFASLAIVAAVSLLLMPVVDNVGAWVVARFGFGFAIGGLYVVIESWMAAISESTVRSQVLSVYMVVVYAGIAAGQQLLSLPDAQGFTRFAVVAGLLCLAALPILMSTHVAPVLPASSPRLWHVAAHASLGTLAALVAGFTSGIVYAVAPVYGAIAGLSAGQIATLMTAFVIGGLSLQVPLGRAADRGDRRRVLAMACTVASLGCLLGLFLETSPALLFAVAFVIGAGVFSLYALAISVTFETIDPNDALSANATLFLVFCTGSATGALLSAAALEGMGSIGFFGLLLAPTAALGVGAAVIPRPLRPT